VHVQNSLADLQMQSKFSGRMTLVFVLLGAMGIGALSAPSAKAQDLSSAEAEKIASDAYLYAYAMLYNYKTLFQQVMDPSFAGYIGGFDRFRNYSRAYTPTDTDIVTPSNDTPYSWAWLDLRAEPMVVSVPASKDRYYVLQWFDLYTHNFAYIGSRATGNEAGDYLIAGPDWHGKVPAGIRKVLHSETQIVGTLTRTAWAHLRSLFPREDRKTLYRVMLSLTPVVIVDALLALPSAALAGVISCSLKRRRRQTQCRRPLRPQTSFLGGRNQPKISGWHGSPHGSVGPWMRSIPPFFYSSWWRSPNTSTDR
jgi:hypothetical protein